MTTNANKLKQAKALRQLQIEHVDELLILAQAQTKAFTLDLS